MDARGLPEPPREYLPPTSAVVELGGFPIAIGFVLLTDSPIAILCNFVSDPSIEKEIRHEAVDILTDVCIDYAKGKGFAAVSGITAVPIMQKRFEKRKFFKIETNLKHYMGVL
jgi:hypothetical protein